MPGHHHRRTNAADKRQEASELVPTLTLRDVVAASSDGDPFELTGSLEDIIGYLDDTVRSDMTDKSDLPFLDEAIAAVRAVDLEVANTRLRPMQITLIVSGS